MQTKYGDFVDVDAKQRGSSTTVFSVFNIYGGGVRSRIDDLLAGHDT